MNYLLYQTLEEIEFIFVDDGSSDRSVTIIQEYMEQYKDKIYLNHTDHTGPGGARNKGIEHARADYIGFADADDYFNYCINDILDEYAAVDADLIFFNANSVDSQTYVQQSKSKHLNQYISLWNSDSHVAELYLRYIFGELLCKMVRMKLLTRVRITSHPS